MRALLVLAYPIVSYLAVRRDDNGLAAFALGDIALILLLRPLLDLRGRAWAAFGALVAAGWWLADSGGALPALRLVPVMLIGLVAYGFGRTLRTGREPLITRMIAGLEGLPPDELSAELRTYARDLTASWAALLGALALFNLALALLLVPGGLLASAGVASPWAIAHAPPAWRVTLVNFGLMIGFFLAEFSIRQRRFPGRYHNLADFLRRMSRLGPAFWRDVMH